MPHRFQIFEKIAFSLVVLFAATCSAYITWENSPNFRDNVRESQELLSKTSTYDYTYSYACTADLSSAPCAQFVQ